MESGWKSKRLFIAFFVWNCILTVCIVGGILYPWCDSNNTSSFDWDEQTQYTLYIGTNDKYTYQQEISIEEAERIVQTVSAKYTNGYTAFSANGGWVDDKGILTQEASLVYTYVNVSEETIQKIMDELLVLLDQNTILVERTEASLYSYSG